MKKKRIKAPWKTGRKDMQSYVEYGGETVPVVYVYRDPEERIPVLGKWCRRDAERIVHAVNNHDELVAALTYLRDVILDEQALRKDHDAIRIATEVIATATT